MGTSVEKGGEIPAAEDRQSPGRKSWLNSPRPLQLVLAYGGLASVLFTLPQLPQLILLTSYVILLAAAIAYCIRARLRSRTEADDGGPFLLFMCFVGVPLVLVLSLCVLVEWGCYWGAI